MFYIFLQSDISEHPLWKEQLKSRMALRDINFKVWLETNLFSPVWWFILILLIGIWFLWWKIVDKTRLMEIVTYGLMVSVSTIIFDIIAVGNVLWGYPIRLTPLYPPILFVDLCLLPVVWMLVYQHFSTWKSYSIASITTAFILSFVVEPLAVWLDIFQLIDWKYVYSFLLYMSVSFFLKWVMNAIKIKQQRSKLQEN